MAFKAGPGLPHQTAHGTQGLRFPWTEPVLEAEPVSSLAAAPALERIMLLAKHKSISLSTMGSRPPWTERGAGAGTGALSSLALTPQIPRPPALALPSGAGVALLVLMTIRSRTLKKLWREELKPCKVKTHSPSVFC